MLTSHSSRLLIGIDGGGTSCRARLSDGNGTLLGEGRAGPANVLYDPKGSWESVLSATRMAFEQAAVDPARIQDATACLGLAGLDPILPQPPAEWPLETFGACMIDTDAFIALRGAHGERDGAILIVGTGAVGLASIGSRRISIGGYGSILSDEGSGSWLGREAARRMLWSADGRRPWSPLTWGIQKELGSPEAVMKWAQTASAADFGRIARIVLATASEGDDAAISLLKKGAAFLNVLIRRLADEGAEQISVLGGLAAPLTPWLEFEKINYCSAQGDALDGALLLAAGLSLREPRTV